MRASPRDSAGFSKYILGGIGRHLPAVEGRNVLDVQARLSEPADMLRPGLLGRAELVAGRMPPLWAWSRHAVERIRLAWWSWLG